MAVFRPAYRVCLAPCVSGSVSGFLAAPLANPVLFTVAVLDILPLVLVLRAYLSLAAPPAYFHLTAFTINQVYPSPRVNPDSTQCGSVPGSLTARLPISIQNRVVCGRCRFSKPFASCQQFRHCPLPPSSLCSPHPSLDFSLFLLPASPPSSVFRPTKRRWLLAIAFGNLAQFRPPASASDPYLLSLIKVLSLVLHLFASLTCITIL